MRTRYQSERKGRKKKPVSESQSESYFQQRTQISQPDPQIEQSNTQLSRTLSVAYRPAQIKCRQSEKQVISKFIKNCIISKGSQGSRVLYISGVPGVGKTVSTMQTVNKIKRTISARKVTFKYINAMNLISPNHIYKAINKQLFKVEKNDLKENGPMKLMGKMQQDKRVKFLIVDQIDYLFTRNQNILYNLFEWCNSPDVKLCTIVIANTMDFPERLHPKVTSRMGQNRLIFKPYSQKELETIIQERLLKSNRFSKQAIQYACKKMASFTSDLRKLLQILKRTVESKKEGTISLDEMYYSWKQYAVETGQLWLQSLSDHYKEIINIVKDHGGTSTNFKIQQRLNVTNNYNMTQVLITLKEMQELSLIKQSQKKRNSLKFTQVTLLKI